MLEKKQARETPQRKLISFLIFDTLGDQGRCLLKGLLLWVSCFSKATVLDELEEGRGKS